MKFRAGVVLPMMVIVCTPVALSAQQAEHTFFVAAEVSAPHAGLSLLQDPPSQKPEDVMATSGMFLGIVGMLGGAVAGAAMSQEGCKDSDDENCRSKYASTGAVVASTFFVPLGVHIANKNKKSFIKSLAFSTAAGAVLYFGTKAIPGEPVQIAPFLAAPLQMVTSLRVERAR
ncbi:MAG TPA: hypothetical protein VGC44_05665 [Longimicrobiales bacterium]